MQKIRHHILCYFCATFLISLLNFRKHKNYTNIAYKIEDKKKKNDTA